MFPRATEAGVYGTPEMFTVFEFDNVPYWVGVTKTIEGGSLWTHPVHPGWNARLIMFNPGVPWRPIHEVPVKYAKPRLVPAYRVSLSMANPETEFEGNP